MDLIRVRPRRDIAKIVLLCVLLGAVFTLASIYLPVGIDWRDTYRPAALMLLSGKSPYGIDIFFAAPWSLLPLVPFAFLPENVGRAALFLVGLGTFAFTAYRLGAKPPALAAFLMSPPVVHCLLNSNIEWLPLLGFALPPQLGLFLVVIKPQIGVGAVVFWLWETWRKGGVKETVRVFWPVTLALLISFVLYGLWPLRFSQTLTLTRAYNASLWPSSIPLGLALLVAAVRKHNMKFAMAASPCLSPYVLLHAWVGALAAVLSQPAETLAAVVGLWILVGIRAFSGGGL